MEVFSNKLRESKSRIFTLRGVKKDLSGKCIGVLEKCGIEGLIVSLDKISLVFKGLHVHVLPLVE